MGVANRLIKTMVRLAPVSVQHRIQAWRYRRNWRERKQAETSHLDTYWDSYRSPRRLELLAYLRDLIEGLPKPVSIIEFGAHCGPNARLMDEEFGPDITFTGIEVNPECVAFASAKLPRFRFIEGDQHRLQDLADLKADIFLVSSVFYVMAPSEVEAVLRFARDHARFVVFADDLSNFSGNETHMDAETGYFQHPYARLCERSSLAVIQRADSNIQQAAWTGIVVAGACA